MSTAIAAAEEPQEPEMVPAPPWSPGWLMGIPVPAPPPEPEPEPEVEPEPVKRTTKK
jgi:hypothetical protein